MLDIKSPEKMYKDFVGQENLIEFKHYFTKYKEDRFLYKTFIMFGYNFKQSGQYFPPTNRFHNSLTHAKDNYSISVHTDKDQNHAIFLIGGTSFSGNAHGKSKYSDNICI